MAILLPTYNGEQYIGEMLDSLLRSQHCDSFVIYIRDDGSKDQTIAILKKYASQYDDTFVLFFGENIGSVKGFNFLLKKSLGDGFNYFMFADQDDIWTEDKVGLVLERLKGADPDQPFLTHSDLYVVDENLKVIDQSFWHYQKLNPGKSSINRLFIQNMITGCTIGINRKLAILAYPIPKEAIMHDWWLALVASAFGTIDVIKKQLVYYRQHSTNTIGAQKYTLKLSKVKARFVMSKYTNQASAFYDRYGDLLNAKQFRNVVSFINLFTVGKMKATALIITHSFYKSGTIRNIGFLLKLWFQKRE